MGSTKETIYTILRTPRITEKAAMLGSTAETVVFDVHPRANKKEIKRAVEKIYEVKVIDVRTVNTLGKGKGRGPNNGGMNSYKKAYVKLQKGASIDVVSGL